MKYFMSIMKYVTLVTLIINTLLMIVWVFDENVLQSINNFCREISLAIECYIFSELAEFEWGE